MKVKGWVQGHLPPPDQGTTGQPCSLVVDGEDWMPEQDCPRGAQPLLGLQLREPRIRAQGLLGQGVAQDPAFSSHAQSDPSPNPDM